MATKHKKHVRKFHLGRPVKPKRKRGGKLGRKPDPDTLRTYTMVRSTEPEVAQWKAAADKITELINLPPGAISFNSWARSELNAAAKRTLAVEVLPSNTDAPAEPVEWTRAELQAFAEDAEMRRG